MSISIQTAIEIGIATVSRYIPIPEAKLWRANLRRADLQGADLRRADLRGAYNILVVGPIGSRQTMLYAVRWAESCKIMTGCFWGTLTAFGTAVLGKSDNDNSKHDYLSLIPFLAQWYKQEDACKVDNL